MEKKEYGIFSLPVIVGSLGFFVDIYDLLIFNITRIASLNDLKVPEKERELIGDHILSWQMIGLVIGGLIWGILGDKKGRKSVLFASIILYSVTTIANGFVQDIETYKWLRFIAALGLAGELGASITLTSEMLPKEKRGIAATIIATSGVMGTIAAYYVFDLSNENWRLCYYIGGAMGLALLFLRVGVLESRMYDNTKHSNTSMGNLLLLVNNKERFIRYLRSILIGLPVWFVIGMVISVSNKFALLFNIEGFDQPRALMLQYVALAFGDLFAGFFSNYIKSRKKTLLLYYGILSVFVTLFFVLKGGGNATNMYLLCMGMGFGSGISVLYITMSAEQFGTNLRATAAISIPNMVRGFTPLMIGVRYLLETSFNRVEGHENPTNYITAAAITGIIVITIGFIAALYTKESFGKDLDFIEK